MGGPTSQPKTPLQNPCARSASSAPISTCTSFPAMAYAPLRRRPVRSRMYRVVVFYEAVPDADSYAEHAELCAQVPNGVFRHGKVTGAPMGEPAHAYYSEWEFADKEAFDAAVRSEEF